jgi:hypothetical protein
MSGFERSNEAGGKVAARAAIRLQHCRPDGVVSHHVGLDAHAVVSEMTSRRNARGARVGGDATTGIQQRDLPGFAALISFQEAAQGVLRRDSFAHHRQPFGSKIEVREGLRRHDTHARVSPRNRSAYGQVARLHGDAKLPGCGVPGDN